MPMSPEVMSALKQVKPAGAVARPPGAAPAAANMMTPQKPTGAMQKGRLQMTVAVKLLEQALTSFGALGKEGKACLDAIKTIARVIGKQEGEADEMLPMEQKIVSAGLPGGAGAAGAPPGGAPKPPGPPGAPPGAAPGGMPPGSGAPPQMPPMAA